MWISRKHYNKLFEKANTEYVSVVQSHSISLYEQLKVASMRQEISTLKSEKQALQLKLEHLNSEQKQKEIEYSKACFNKAIKLLEEGKVAESELAMRLYEQYK